MDFALGDMTLGREGTAPMNEANSALSYLWERNTINERQSRFSSCHMIIHK